MKCLIGNSEVYTKFQVVTRGAYAVLSNTLVHDDAESEVRKTTFVVGK